MNKQKPYWIDYCLSSFKWYRKYRGGDWYKHKFTNDALELSVSFIGYFWVRYKKINRYSDVILYETH